LLHVGDLQPNIENKMKNNEQKQQDFPNNNSKNKKEEKKSTSNSINSIITYNNRFNLE
jgi:hypothetical protein